MHSRLSRLRPPPLDSGAGLALFAACGLVIALTVALFGAFEALALLQASQGIAAGVGAS